MADTAADITTDTPETATDQTSQSTTDSRPPAQQQQAQQPVDDALPGITEQATAQAPRRRGKQARHRVRSRHERAGRRAGVPVKPISLSVPASIATAWRSYSQKHKHSLVDVMLDAVVANKERLTDLVRSQQAAARADRLPVSDGTFLRTTTVARRPSPEEAGVDPNVTVPLRMLSTNVDTLDALSFETAAESRSQLVVAALSAYLTDQGFLAPQVAADPAPGTEAGTS